MGAAATYYTRCVDISPGGPGSCSRVCFRAAMSTLIRRESGLAGTNKAPAQIAFGEVWIPCCECTGVAWCVSSGPMTSSRGRAAGRPIAVLHQYVMSVAREPLTSGQSAPDAGTLHIQRRRGAPTLARSLALGLLRGEGVIGQACARARARAPTTRAPEEVYTNDRRLGCRSILQRPRFLPSSLSVYSPLATTLS